MHAITGRANSCIGANMLGMLRGTPSVHLRTPCGAGRQLAPGVRRPASTSVRSSVPSYTRAKAGDAAEQPAAAAGLREEVDGMLASIRGAAHVNAEHGIRQSNRFGDTMPRIFNVLHIADCLLPRGGHSERAEQVTKVAELLSHELTAVSTTHSWSVCSVSVSVACMCAHSSAWTPPAWHSTIK